MHAALVLVSLLLAAAPPETDHSRLDELTDALVLARAEEVFRAGALTQGNPEKARTLFAESAACYELLHQRGVANADLYRNQGNAYLLADRLPQAILAYRRGLRLAPNDGLLRENLEFARKQVQYPSADNRVRPPDDDWPPLLPRPEADLLLAAALIANALAWLVATRWLMMRRTSLLLLAGTAFLLAAAAGAGWAHLLCQEHLEAETPLVVIAKDDVGLHRGNGLTYPRHNEMPLLHRGMEARRLYERGGWLQIELPGGEIGWVPCTAVLVDEP